MIYKASKVSPEGGIDDGVAVYPKEVAAAYPQSFIFSWKG
jgi:hypothetical protein